MFCSHWNASYQLQTHCKLRGTQNVCHAALWFANSIQHTCRFSAQPPAEESHSSRGFWHELKAVYSWASQMCTGLLHTHIHVCVVQCHRQAAQAAALTGADLDMDTRRALSPSSGVTLQKPAVTLATSGLRMTSPACAYCSALPICKPLVDCHCYSIMFLCPASSIHSCMSMHVMLVRARSLYAHTPYDALIVSIGTKQWPLL